MSARNQHHGGAVPARATAVPSPRRLGWLLAAWCGMAALTGFGASYLCFFGPTDVGARSAANGSTAARADRPRDLYEVLVLPDSELEKVDVVELDLAIARQIPECRDLDVRRYQRTVDEWAAWVKHEIDRHMYRLEAHPEEFPHGKPELIAGLMVTVVGQDYGVTYNREDFSFSNHENDFLHGIIDRRKGTCATMPLLYVALGQRLGYPIRAVRLPGHLFCRWDDPVTGEQMNMETTNGGLTVHDDEYYRHWPYELDPRWEREHGMLKSLTMRELAAVMVGSLAGYYSGVGDEMSAIRWDALALSLDPSNRSGYVVLRRSLELLAPRYLDAEELAGRKQYWALTPHPSTLTSPTYSRNAITKADRPAKP